MTSQDPADDPHRLSRRRLLRLGGGAGLSALVAACATWETNPASAPGPATSTSDPGAPSSPSPTPTTGVKEASPRPSPTVDETPRPDARPTPTPDPEPTPTPTPTGTPAAAGVLLCRDAWGAKAPLPGGTPHTITRMTIHHTAVVLGDNSNITARLRQHQQYHQGQGWVDIAYHVGVDRNGNIFELRTPDIAGDTFTSYDPAGHFLVVCEGHFDQEQVSDAQLDGAALAFAWAAQTFDVSSATLAGHRDFVPSTSCPGSGLYSHVASGGLKARVDDLLARGPVDLRPICGDEAAAVVGAIEAG